MQEETEILYNKGFPLVNAPNNLAQKFGFFFSPAAC